jgi:hypothetical protein
MPSLVVNSLLTSILVAHVAAKKRTWAYAGAFVFGLVKAVIYFALTKSVLLAATAFVAFTVLASILTYASLRFQQKSATLWQLALVAPVLILLIFGEKIVFALIR